IGVGALGQAHAIKASIMGSGQVIVVDPSELRVNITARLAKAEPVVGLAEDVVDRVLELTGGEGVDVSINATGFPGSFNPSIRMLRDGGTLIEVGNFVDMGEEMFNPAVLCGRNLTMMGIGGEDLLAYENTIALLDRHNGDIPFAEMISHRFPVSDAPDAMALALDSFKSAKVLITEDLLKT
ncbi:MAG: zinc-binding dehydrogenase, partial [Actinomycetota bacterium]|nr:zinc-binding dehydrogenase [Actinomycetota bacterium]